MFNIYINIPWPSALSVCILNINNGRIEKPCFSRKLNTIYFTQMRYECSKRPVGRSYR